MPRTHFVVSVAGLLAFTLALPAGAVSTRQFSLDSAETLEKGELDGTAVRSDGRITHGVHTQRFSIEDAALAFSVARLPDGIAIGTGSQGRVYRLHGDRLSVLAETGEAVVTALVGGPGGDLYAGTLPSGKIVRIDAASGEVTPFAQPEGAEHIWALAYDAKRQLLFAATGPQGKVFAIDAQGRVDLYYDSEAEHVMALALDEDGTLYAGTSDQALVLRIAGPGRAQVVRDLPGNEVTALDVRAGRIAAAANAFPDPSNVGGNASKTRNARGSAPRRPKPGKGHVWRIAPDGRAEEVLALEKNHFASVQLDAQGRVFAGTGQDGRIYRIEPSGEHALWVDVDERQVLGLDVAGEDPVFITGDAAAAYRVHPRAKRPALWTSAPLDAKFEARWGQLTWRGTGRIALQTRTGNTEKPDATWTDWSTPLTNPAPTRSPSGRFLQVRAQLLEPGSEVYAMTAYYLPQNQRPVIRQVEVAQPEQEGKSSAPQRNAKSTGQGPEGASATYKLQWKVESADDDTLRYRLFYRAEGQSRWRTILQETEVLSETHYLWDTGAIPDGYYRVRVKASDELDNPAPYALTAEAVSEPVRIDNHAPRIEKLRFIKGAVTGRAVDAMGPIHRLEYAIDGGEWRVFFPSDDLLDTASERFALELPGNLEPGSHIVAVRATDGAGNGRTAELVVEVGHRR